MITGNCVTCGLKETTIVVSYSCDIAGGTVSTVKASHRARGDPMVELSISGALHDVELDGPKRNVKNVLFRCPPVTVAV